MVESINVTSLTHAGHTLEHIGVVTHFVTMLSGRGGGGGETTPKNIVN